jgi:hypothetical protein
LRTDLKTYIGYRGSSALAAVELASIPVYQRPTANSNPTFSIQPYDSCVLHEAGIFIMTVLKADYEQLKAQLEDTQASLAAAFARIEAFRLREKLLVQEIAKLRLGGSVDNLHIASTDAPSTQATSTGSQGQQNQGESSKQDGEAEQAGPAGPYYITEMADQPLPILFVNGGRKVS